MKFQLILMVAMATVVCGVELANEGGTDFKPEGCLISGHSVMVGGKFYPTDQCVEITCTAPGSIATKTCPDISGKCEPIPPPEPHRIFPYCCPVVPETC